MSQGLLTYPVVSLTDWPECIKVAMNIQICILILLDFEGGDWKWLMSPLLTWQHVWRQRSMYRTAASSTSRHQSQHDMTRIEEMPIRYDRVHRQVIRSIVSFSIRSIAVRIRVIWSYRNDEHLKLQDLIDRVKHLKEKMTELRCRGLLENKDRSMMVPITRSFQMENKNTKKLK